jgi:AcrR family transcriptional regulator
LADNTANFARDRVREARRLALIEAAEQVFAERGFDGATMADIAARAGYSAGNLYNVFEGKQALFRAVVSARGNLLLERLREAFGQLSSLPARIDALVETLISFVEEHRAFFSIYVQTTSGFAWNVGRLDEQALEMQALLEEEVTRTVQGAIQSGEIPREEPELYTCLLLGTLQRYLTRWVQRDGGSRELGEGAEAIRRILRRALGVK